jgi:hypothetical protein
LLGNVPCATARQLASTCHPRTLCYQTLNSTAERGNERVTQSCFRLPSSYVPETKYSQEFVLYAKVLDVVVKLEVEKPASASISICSGVNLRMKLSTCQFTWTAIYDASFDLLDASTDKTRGSSFPHSLAQEDERTHCHIPERPSK